MQNEVDVIQSASNLSRVVFENDRIRILNVVFQPGDKAPEHHHPDHVIYVKSGGKLKLVVEGKTDVLELKTGETVFMDETSHEVENVGDSTVDLIVVELK